jgi:hypothetical protein
MFMYIRKQRRNHSDESKSILYKRWINRRKTLGIVVARCSHKAIKDKEMGVIMVQSNQSDDTKKAVYTTERNSAL